MMMMTLSELKEHVAVARRAAVQDAKGGYRTIRSRGTFLATADALGHQCEPWPEADALDWKGTIKEVNEALATIPGKYPEVTEIYIAGGYDGTDSPRDFVDGNYEPWVSSWKVTLWNR